MYVGSRYLVPSVTDMYRAAKGIRHEITVADTPGWFTVRDDS